MLWAVDFSRTRAHGKKGWMNMAHWWFSIHDRSIDKSKYS